MSTRKPAAKKPAPKAAPKKPTNGTSIEMKPKAVPVKAAPKTNITLTSPMTGLASTYEFNNTSYEDALNSIEACLSEDSKYIAADDPETSTRVILPARVFQGNVITVKKVS